MTILLGLAVPAGSQTASDAALGGVSLTDFLKHAALARQIVDYEGTKVLSALRGSLMETVTLNESHKRPAKTRLSMMGRGRGTTSRGSIPSSSDPRSPVRRSRQTRCHSIATALGSSVARR
jgi:hypothetical protein